ncbi:uncharacterized protein LOC107269803 [Cephus cinctus]|uniref:Uncharacterized protein LOC107269803 n=1 Tax=Cephus cinctus TaxID=211228 RepID=A0AAJ7C223_CEPCN|nr:uncharacterized protein LOC107269803 [Cephus cinctus]
MVMAGTEGVPGPAMEEPLSSRLQWLQQRREALQDKLAQKNNELKNLCVEEAELTGVLPPEIPLEPGESPPTFRRRVGTAFTYPQNLINKLKSSEAEESALELERQVQVGIAEAALGIFNDPAESKAVRRKHRLVYQQSQRRLQDLDARLNFIRQSHGKSHRQTQLPHVYGTQPYPQAHVKHRTKKPRPPLESTGSEGSAKSSRGVLQEGGVSLSPLGPEHNYNTYPGHGFQDGENIRPIVPNVYNHNRIGHPAVSPVMHRQSPKLIEHDLNDNHNVYILPEPYRTRTYSHGSGGSRNHNHYTDAERNYRPVPNTYTEHERQLRHRQLQHQQQQLQNHQHYPQEYRTLDNDVQLRHPSQAYYEAEPHVHRYAHTPDYQLSCQHHSQSQSLQRRERELTGTRIPRNPGPPNDPHQPPGYWMRYENDIIWCSDEKPVDRFGSLDRRKHNALQNTNSTGIDPQSRYHTVAGNKTSSMLPRHHLPLYPPLSEQAPPNRMLLRTQSLGSVETWHSGYTQESPDNKDTTDNIVRKKEKEWYETSLDTASSPGPGSGSGSGSGSVPAVIHQNFRQPTASIPSIPKVIPPSRELLSEDQDQRNHRREMVQEEQRQHLQALQNRYHQPGKIPLEIPAESKHSDNNEVPLESPKNCTIVQAGKYQPYREVTKPFEMSDFYKYSTKFRKRTENSQGQVTTDSTNHVGSLNPSKPLQDRRIDTMVEMSQELTLSNVDDGILPNPVQKRIYQPLQRMTCQPYGTLRPEDASSEWHMSEIDPTSSATLV